MHYRYMYISCMYLSNLTTPKLQKTAIVSNFTKLCEMIFVFRSSQNARDELTAFFSFPAPNRHSTKYKITTQTNTHREKEKRRSSMQTTSNQQSTSNNTDAVATCAVSINLCLPVQYGLGIHSCSAIAIVE